MNGSNPIESRSESVTSDAVKSSRKNQKSATTHHGNHGRAIGDKFFKTICLFVGFTNLGLASPLLGTTLVHLERLFDVSTSTVSISLPVQSAGYLAGSILCGVLFDRVNHELAFAIANIVMGFGIILAPFLGGLVPFIAAMCVQAVSQGFVDAGTQSYSAKLWAGHRYREPVVHTTHALWSLGGTVSPFIIARFLVDLPQQLQHLSASTTGTWSTSLADEEGEATSAVSIWNLTTSSDGLHVDVSKTRFAYVTIGSLVLVAGLLYLAAFLRDRSRRDENLTPGTLPDARDRVNSTTSRNQQDDIAMDSPSEFADKGVKNENSSMKNDRFAYVVFIGLVFIFFNLYPFSEVVPIACMTTFTVKYLNFPIQNASLLMSLFFGLHFAGRMLGIPVSVFIRPRTMIIINLFLTAVSFVLLLAFVNVWPTIIWISAPMAAVSMATTFGTTILWIGERTPVTGALASISIVGYSVGHIVGPLIVSQLFESSTPMWFVYVLVIASVSHVIVFLVLMVFDSRCGERVRRAATGHRLDASDVIVV